jgi:hypothetical protein
MIKYRINLGKLGYSGLVSDKGEIKLEIPKDLPPTRIIEIEWEKLPDEEVQTSEQQLRLI